MTGTIKTLTDRGFGFIAREGEAKDLFFHSKELQGVTFDELKVGDMLNFEVVQGDKGPNAVNISRA
jgi:CspA family cold shock protein